MWKNLSVEELSLRCSIFPVCPMMEGAVLVDDRSGVTFDAELCIPWDALRAVVDITSTEAFTPVSLPHGVVLLGRDRDIDDQRIPPDGDGRVVRFRRPDVCSGNRESCDVRTVVMKEAEELPTSEVTSLICVWWVGFTTKDLGDVRSMDSEKCDSSKTGLTMEY